MLLKNRVCWRLYFRVSPLPLNFYTTKVSKISDIAKHFAHFNIYLTLAALP